MLLSRLRSTAATASGVLNGEVERRGAAAVPEPGIGAVRQQRVDGGRATRANRPMQGCHSALVCRVRIGTRSNQELDRGGLSLRVPVRRSRYAGGRIVQRLRPSPIPRCGIRAVRDEIVRDVRPVGCGGDVQRRVACVDIVPDLGEEVRSRCPAAGADGRRCPGEMRRILNQSWSTVAISCRNRAKNQHQLVASLVLALRVLGFQGMTSRCQALKRFHMRVVSAWGGPAESG